VAVLMAKPCIVHTRFCNTHALNGQRAEARLHKHKLSLSLSHTHTKKKNMCSLEMESDNWRFRQLLASQLGTLRVSLHAQYAVYRTRTAYAAYRTRTDGMRHVCADA
jgi:hypothetical protein